MSSSCYSREGEDGTRQLPEEAQRHCREQELRLRLANLHVELGELHIQHLMTLSDMMSEFGHDEEHCDATQTSRARSEMKVDWCIFRGLLQTAYTSVSQARHQLQASALNATGQGRGALQPCAQGQCSFSSTRTGAYSGPMSNPPGPHRATDIQHERRRRTEHQPILQAARTSYQRVSTDSTTAYKQTERNTWQQARAQPVHSTGSSGGEQSLSGIASLSRHSHSRAERISIEEFIEQSQRDKEKQDEQKHRRAIYVAVTGSVAAVEILEQAESRDHSKHRCKLSHSSEVLSKEENRYFARIQPREMVIQCNKCLGELHTRLGSCPEVIRRDIIASVRTAMKPWKDTGEQDNRYPSFHFKTQIWVVAKGETPRFLPELGPREANSRFIISWLDNESKLVDDFLGCEQGGKLPKFRPFESKILY